MRPYLNGPLVLIILIAVLNADCRAQAVAVPLEPQALAVAALQGLSGTAAAATLRDNMIQVAVRGASTAKGAEPIFEIGSISKVFTGLLLAQAVESKEVSLDDTIGVLLKASVPFDSERTAAITLRQLVTHTSCLPRLPENPNRVPAASQLTSYGRAQLWSELSRLALPRQPPCASEYSNFGMAVLAELLSQRAGRPWKDLVRIRITGPLGMRDTFVKIPKRHASRLAEGFVRDVPAHSWAMDAFAGAGGLRSTATDLLIFSKALLKGRQGPLGPAAERLVTDLAAYGTGTARIGYAVFLPTSPTRVWTHSGITGGHVAEWIVWPQRRESVVILVSNLASPSRGIARSLIETTQ